MIRTMASHQSSFSICGGSVAWSAGVCGWLIAAVVGAILPGCSSPPKVTDELVRPVGEVRMSDEAAGQRVVDIRLELGAAAYASELPQYAIWITDEHGLYLDTVYVTGKTGREGLGNAYLMVLGATVRESPDALPVWAHARGVRYDQSVYPTKDTPLPDAITGATPAATQLAYYFRVPETHAGETIRVLTELNVSLDSVPSMVYEAVIPLDSPDAPVEFVYLGQGHPDGLNGRVTPADNAAQAAQFLASGRAELWVNPSEEMLVTTVGNPQVVAGSSSGDPLHILYGLIGFGCIVIAAALITINRAVSPKARPYIRSFHAIFAVGALLLMVMHVKLLWREPLGLASAALLVALSASYAIEPLRRFKAARLMHRFGGYVLIALILAHAVKTLWLGAG